MSQSSRNFFQESKYPGPESVVDLTGNVTSKENTPTKKKADVLSDYGASPLPKKKTVSLAIFQSWKYGCIGNVV